MTGERGMRRVLYKIYSYVVALPLFVIATIVVSTLVIVASLLGDTRYVSWYVPRLWSRFTIRTGLHSVRLEGLERLDPGQSYVFLANHQGYFDIFLLYGYLPNKFKWMMKEYLRRLPFVGLACARSEQIFVGESRASIVHAVRQAEKTLRGGTSMVIFPEGTRTHTGRMNPFKRGAFMLAGEIGLPIVPITINGSFDIFSRNDYSVSQGTLSMKIHAPIPPEEYKKLNTKVLMQRVYDTIEGGLDEKYRTGGTS